MHNKSKKSTKLEKNRKSVFTDDLDYCYLCVKRKMTSTKFSEAAIELTPSNIISSYHYAENAILAIKIIPYLTIIGTSKVNCTGKKISALEKSLSRYLEEII